MQYLMKRRVEKMLETSAVVLTIKTDHPALPAHITLNVGTPSVGFLPDMEVRIDDEGFDCLAKIRFLGPEVREVRVRWDSIVKVEVLPCPDPGGSKVNLSRAA